MGKIVKSVSLNENNEEDLLILKAVKRRNFSGYVKKLILADIEAKKEQKMAKQAESLPEPAVAAVQIPSETKKVEPVQKTEASKSLTSAERLQQLKNQAQRQQGSPAMPPIFKPNQRM